PVLADRHEPAGDTECGALGLLTRFQGLTSHANDLGRRAFGERPGVGFLSLGSPSSDLRPPVLLEAVLFGHATTGETWPGRKRLGSRVGLSGRGLDREALDAAGAEEGEVLGDGGVLSGRPGGLVE